MRPSWRAPVVLALVGVVGLVAFGWPLVVRPGAGLGTTTGHGADASYALVVVVGLLAAGVLAELSSGGLDAKTVAVLGVLAAAGAALRVLSAGTTGLEPMFFLLVLAGRALGATRGFLLGALTMLASAFLTAGVGPWTPFQMLAAGWFCLGAGLLPRVPERGERWLLAAYGLVAGLAYGALMNLWFWPFLGDSAPAGAGFDPGAGPAANLAAYGVFYLTTSLLWDLPRGVLTAALTWLAGPALLRALRRSIRQAHFESEATVGAAAQEPV